MGRISLPLVGVASIVLFGCMQTTTQDSSAPNIADRPFPQSLTSSQWCAAAEEAKNDPKIKPNLRRRYVDAAVAHGCYGPPPKQVYYKDGATNEEFQRTRARCLMQAEMAQSGV